MMIGAMRIRYFHRGILGGLVELPHKSGANLAYVAIDGVPAPTMQFDLPPRQADLDAVTAFCTYAREVGCIHELLGDGALSQHQASTHPKPSPSAARPGPKASAIPVCGLRANIRASTKSSVADDILP